MLRSAEKLKINAQAWASTSPSDLSTKVQMFTLSFPFERKSVRGSAFVPLFFSACNWTVNWHYWRFQTLGQVGELSEGGRRRKGMYRIPNCQFKGSTLNFVLSNRKNLIPLWVKVVWDNLSLCFHMPHLYPCKLLYASPNKPHPNVGHHCNKYSYHKLHQ